VVSVTDTPWLDQHEDETEEQYNTRLAHTCYQCGAYFVILDMLWPHEDECEGIDAEVSIWRLNERK
jgi:hypothetical protein